MTSNQEIKPLDHQSEILEELDLKGAQRNLIVLPSGAGKTHTLAFDVKRKNPRNFLYIVHRNEILEQSVNIFKDVLGISDSEIGKITGNVKRRSEKQKQYFKKYLFATVQTLAIEKNLMWLPKEIDYLCVDEYHHAAADTYQRLLNHFKQIGYFVGLSATPYRLDQKDIMSFVDNNTVGNIDVLTGIERGILVPFHYVGLWDNVDYSNIRYENHKYYERDLDKVLLIKSRDDAIVKEYHDRVESFNGGDNLTIGFCNSVNHVLRMVKRFNEEGIKAAGISHLDDMEERQKILGDFRDGKTKIIFTRDILNEGVDFPECNSIMLLRPTVSKTVFFQQIGRGLRKFPDKKRVLILDFIGNYVNAFEKREWLDPFLKATGTHLGIHKPVFNYTPATTVEFDERVISLFELQKEALKGWVEQDLIDNYYATERRLIESGEMDKRKFKGVGLRDIKDKRYSKISFRPYLNRWGSWNNFVDYIHAKKNKISPTDVQIEEIMEKYFKLKNKLGKAISDVVSRSEFEKEYSYFGSKKINQLGGWKAILSKYLKERKINKCRVCGKEFETSHVHERFYCSDQCDHHQENLKTRNKRIRAPKILIEKICQNPECNKKFSHLKRHSHQKYCSPSCKDYVKMIAARNRRKKEKLEKEKLVKRY